MDICCHFPDYISVCTHVYIFQTRYSIFYYAVNFIHTIRRSFHKLYDSHVLWDFKLKKNLKNNKKFRIFDERWFNRKATVGPTSCWSYKQNLLYLFDCKQCVYACMSCIYASEEKQNDPRTKNKDINPTADRSNWTENRN